MKKSLPALLKHCTTQGIKLSPDGENQLAIDAPKGTTTPELLAQLKSHKPALLAYLKTGEIAPDAEARRIYHYEKVGDVERWVFVPPEHPLAEYRWADFWPDDENQANQPRNGNSDAVVSHNQEPFQER